MPVSAGADMRIHTSRLDDNPLRTRTSVTRRRGSAVVEFALSSIVFMAFLFGIIDFCRAVYTYEFVTYAARAGARWAMVRGNQCFLANPASWCDPAGSSNNGATNADIQTYVQSLHMPGIAAHSIKVTANWAATGSYCPSATTTPNNSPGCPVEVIVQYPYTSQIPFIHVKIVTLTADSTMVISQ